MYATFLQVLHHPIPPLDEALASPEEPPLPGHDCSLFAKNPESFGHALPNERDWVLDQSATRESISIE